MPFIGRLPLILALVLPELAAAQSARDEASGLAVTPPPGYDVRPLPPLSGQAARFGLHTPADTDTGCQVSFTPVPQNNRFSQAELDAVMAGTAWQGMARTAISSLYAVRESATLPLKGRTGFVMVGDFQERPDLPPRARAVRTLFVIQESPRGRTSTVCVGERMGFDARRSEFMAVAAGAVVP